MSELSTQIRNTFLTRLSRDRRLKTLANRIRDGTDYNDANEYAVRVGELMYQSLDDNTKDMVQMSYDEAKDIFEPNLTDMHSVITQATQIVQRNINDSNDLGIGIITPELDTNRIAGFIEKMSSAPMEEVRYIMHEPVINYGMAIVDQSIRDNARANTKLGLKATIVRKTEPYAVKSKVKIIRGKKYPYSYVIPCRWCASMAGTYNYEDVSNTGNDVFRRHVGCRCELTYIQGARRQDAWYKAEWTGEDANARTTAVQQKEQEHQAQVRAQAVARQRRNSNLQIFQSVTGYSAKSASIMLNKYKNEVQEYGVGWLVDMVSSQNPIVRERLASNPSLRRLIP